MPLTHTSSPQEMPHSAAALAMAEREAAVAIGSLKASAFEKEVRELLPCFFGPYTYQHCFKAAQITVDRQRLVFYFEASSQAARIAQQYRIDLEAIFANHRLEIQ